LIYTAVIVICDAIKCYQEQNELSEVFLPGM